MKTRLLPSHVLALCILGISAATSVSAGDYTFTGPTTGSNYSWATTTTWNPASGSSGPSGSDNIVGRASTSGGNLILSGAREINNFSYDGAGANDWNVVANATAASLTIHGTLSLSGTAGDKKLIFRTSNDTHKLTLDIQDISVSGGTLQFGSWDGTSDTTAVVQRVTVQGMTTITGGTLQVHSTGPYNLGLLNISGGEVGLNGSQTATADGAVSGITGSGGGTIRGSATNRDTVTNLTVDVASGNNYSTGASLIDGGKSSSRLNIIKAGEGSQIFKGASTYSGTTTINAGRLTADHNQAFGTSHVTVNSGGTAAIAAGRSLGNQFVLNGGRLVVNGTLASTASFSFDGTNGGRLSGNGGIINQSISFNSTRQILAPGDVGIGALTFGVSQTWQSFTYDWKLNNWSGAVAGVNFDQVNITGTLNLSGNSSGSYLLNLNSLVGIVVGNVPSFVEGDRSWTIVTADSITGFNADYWKIVSDNFTSSLGMSGEWSLTLGESNKSLSLVYTAIPEPASLGFTACSLLLGGASLMKRKRLRLRSGTASV